MTCQLQMQNGLRKAAQLAQVWGTRLERVPEGAREGELSRERTKREVDSVLLEAQMPRVWVILR